jgi:hypothetical protein
MVDREKVIKALECCIIRYPDDKARCDECPYESACCNRLKNDALALLKAQEPRLVEPNDFENADDFNWLPAWCEERTGAGYWEMILPDALDEKDVRYWTGRPTDEQREAVKWYV